MMPNLVEEVRYERVQPMSVPKAAYEGDKRREILSKSKIMYIPLEIEVRVGHYHWRCR